MNVSRTQGVRAPLPPFTEEHEELRETVAQVRQRRRSPRTSRSGRRRASSRASCSSAAASSGSSASSSRRSTAARAATTSTTPSGSRSCRARRGGGVAAGLGAHAEIAMPPVWKFGTEEQNAALARARRSRARRSARSGSPSPARAPTSPRSGPTAKHGGRRLRRQRLQDLHHQRRPRRLPRLRGQDHRGGRPPRHLLPRPRAGDARLRGRQEAGEDGLARLRHRRALLHRRRGPGREPARRRERGLPPDHGQLPVGAADDGARRRRRDAAACST